MEVNNVCARMGRPPKADVSRSKSLNIRLTPIEAERIQKCADALNLNRTDTLMYGISLIEQGIKK